MSRRKDQVLIVEDSDTIVTLYREYLAQEPLELLVAETGKAARELLERHSPPVTLLDLRLPDESGMEILKWVGENAIPTTVVVMTGHGSVNTAVEAMRLGAFNFIEKPCEAERLRVTVRNALEKQQLRALVDTIRDDFHREQYHGFIGASLPMQAVYRIIEAAAPSKATIFITGESGTGKEVCAEAIHLQSPRNDQPFVPINCGAIPRDLMESEIFGHTKGAFTGAVAERQGAASRADGGTLFLDEIGEMDMELQAKLLRFVQTGTFQKVGGSRIESVDVRFICATNRDPLEMVSEGRFREDLYYRLHVIPIHLPPLRDRDADILAIAGFFLQNAAKEEGREFTGFSPEVERIFMEHDWPGNVRQLQNVIRNVVILNQGTVVEPEMLPPPLNEATAPPASPGPASAAGAAPTPPPVAGSGEQVIKPLWQVEKEAIEAAIEFCGGNVPQAAGLLEVSPSTLYRKRATWNDG